MIKCVFLFLFMAVGGSFAARSSFDEAWKFSLGDTTGAERTTFEDADWRTLDVPHDWSIEGDYDKQNPMGDKCGYLPAGIGWYRKTIDVPIAWKGQHVEIAFDGVYMNSTVWANGQKLGTRPYGWSSFAYDISEIAESADTITFAVRADNSMQPCARWYTGSGIYAHTWIDVKQKIHVPTDGIFVRTTGDTVEVDAEVRNTIGNDQKVMLKVTLIDPAGKEVAQESSTVMATVDDLAVSRFKFEVSDPKRWDLEAPNLYQCQVEVMAAGTASEISTTRFGIRDVEWRPESGMWLNGKVVKLQGVCNHQDAGALGAAVPDKVLRFRIEQLKAMGCNAIRTSHNPQTPIFYDLCDEIGMLVMDEIFDGWVRKAPHDYGRYYFNEWWNRDLTDWIKRDRNHPCVVIYSVGNETRGPIAKELVARCHELDPTRPVTSGHSASEEMDVLGVNGTSEKLGWFKTMPTDRVFIGTENTHTWQVRGYYRTKTWFRNGYPSKSQKPHAIPDLTDKEVFTHDWIEVAGRSNKKQIFNSSYDNATVRLNSRQNIEQLRDIPNYAGSFRWTGYDYIGEAGYVHGGWPFKSFMGGAIDMANFEKDLFYLYQSQWTVSPMVHILPHWTHPTMTLGTEIPVWVYSNCDEVELFFNDQSLGKQRPATQWDSMQCQWMVGWEPGELKAVGTREGMIVSEEVIRTAGAPAKIELSIDGKPLAEEGKDLVQVRVQSTDESGEFYPYGENRTAFSVFGPGQIRALDNGSPIDVEKHFRAKDRIAFYGLTRAYVESTGEAGDITLLATSILGEKKQVTSNKVSIDTQHLALRGKQATPKIEIFYTVDGSAPTEQSERYRESFSVPLGTTVQAIVMADGELVQTVSERFAADEGFVWNQGGKSAATLGGDQAEDATLSGCTVISAGKNFNGKGFVDFGKSKGAYIEWYQENDGGAGPADLIIRYSGKVRGKSGRPVKLTVNGKVVKKALMLPNTKDWGTDWTTIKVPIQLGRGANTIRLSTIGAGGMYIDEIAVR